MTLRLSAVEDDLLSRAAGGRSHVGGYMRSAALALVEIEAALADEPGVAVDRIREIVAGLVR